MKNFLIAIIIALVLVNCIGSVFNDWLGIHLVMSDELLGPWESVAMLSAIGVVFVAIGFIVAISLIGTILVAVAAALLTLFVVGIGAFWPIVVITILLYAFKSKPTRQQKVNHQF